MSEIPEHLLKRSAAAKAAKTGESTPISSDDASANSTATTEAPTSKEPAVASPAVPSADLPYLDPEPEPEKPESPAVLAAKSRHKIPVWALPVVVFLPVWAFGLAGTLQEPETEDVLLIGGANVYNVTGGCAGCHGASGDGGRGYQLSDGEVSKTFPEPIDQMVHVARGSSEINGEPYGSDRGGQGRRISGGSGNGVMPAQVAGLTLEELEMVVYHERVVLGGDDPNQPGYPEWQEHMRQGAEAHTETPIDMDFLLACANPEYTPGATGEGSSDPEDRPCPGPHAESE